MKILLATFVSIMFFALTYTSAPTEFASYDLGILACLIAGVLGIQALLARKLARTRITFNLLMAGFTTANILYLNLTINEAFVELPKYGQVLMLLLALFILTTFMNMMDEYSALSKLLPAIFALATIGILTQSALSTAAVPEVSIEPGKTSAKNIRLVNFKTKPNVYFIGFDSLIPKVLLQKNLNLKSTPYHLVLETHFKRIRNFFADRIVTKNSLNSLLALDIGHFSETAKSKTEHYFFPGLIPSPLFEIFKYNGYETTTHFSSQYLGNRKGPYVDNYNYKIKIQDLRWGVCQFINTGGLKSLTFMGYCFIVKHSMFRPILWSVLRAFRGKSRKHQTNRIDSLIEKMKNGLKNNTPQVFVAYIFSPGHTELAFDRNDKHAFDKYRKYYLKKSKNTAVEINKIVAFISKKDPEAIVYIFGDHGPILSRRDSFESAGTFYIQDRFGIYGGIHPRERCAKSFASPYNKEFMTITQGAHLIIRCLSGGINAFVTLEDYRLPEIETKDNIRYENYLYE